jgi:fucose 4-O-acetylase-like acetyltransferase
MGNRTQRIRAIDTLRGISILYMVVGHAALVWVTGDDLWFPTLIPLVLDMIGSCMFIFLSGISLSLSYSAKQRKVNEDPNYLQIHAHVDFLVKTFWILLFAFIYNLLASTILLYGTTLWIWFVLLSISIGRLCCYPFLKISPWFRIIIGLIFFSLADYLLNLLSSSVEYSIIYYLLFNGRRLDYPFPFFGFFFVGSAIGQWVSKIDFLQSSEDNFYPKFIRNLIISGLILIVFGISIGSDIETQDIFAQGFTSYLNRSPLFNISGLLRFVLRATTPWSFYCLGFELILLAAFLHINKLNYSKKLNKRAMGFVLLGQNSLTIYMVHYLFFKIYSGSLTIPIYFIIGPFLGLVVYCLFWVWAKKGNSKGTIEWLMKWSIDRINNKISLNKKLKLTQKS